MSSARTVVVVGGTGLAGRAVVAQAVGAGLDVRVVARRVPDADRRVAGATYRVADAGAADQVTLTDTLAGADAVVETLNVPLTGAAALPAAAARVAQAARAAGVRHVVPLPIVHVDRGASAYYRAKVRQEQAYLASGVPTTVVRAAQFHDFFDLLHGAPTRAGAVSRLGLLPYPRAGVVQPIDVTDVARALVAAVVGGPDGDLGAGARVEGAPGARTVTVAGPEVLGTAELTRRWRRAHGSRRVPVGVPLPGFGRYYASGDATAPDARWGTVTYDEWLARR